MSLWFKSARLARGVAALLLGMGAGLMDLPVAAQEKSQSPALSTEATKSITGGETLTLNPKTVERIQSLETQRFEAVQPGPMPKATPMTPATTVTAKDWYPNVLSGQHLALQGQTALADEKYKTALKAAATPLERSQTLLSWAESYSRAARQADVAAD